MLLLFSSSLALLSLHIFSLYADKMVKLMLLASFLAGLALASPLSSPYVLHERRLQTHPRWVRGGRVHASSVFPMRIALAQSNLESGEDYLMDVYVPVDAR